ncbi:PAS domain-containing protein [Novosphingobium sp.]|uniref:PAS domain-containing protein n=1 Tax=Novosphingobium sp. TaxID=1874826 RepID=UPI0025FF3E23|nr:PAS domain-containing protein [Novosphingobium sp.]
MRADDCPLVCINPAFTAVTGYSEAEALGRNCRFLQPPGEAGPVRAAIKAYLNDPGVDNGRFIIPNCRRDGTPILNLVYMAKLHHNASPAFVLGSQFVVTAENGRSELYDRALSESLDQIRDLFSGSEWTLLGSTEALASSLAIIARYYLEQGS